MHAEWTLQSYVKSQTSTVRVQYTVYGAVVSTAASLQEGCGFNAQRSLDALSVSPWLISSSAAFLSEGKCWQKVTVWKLPGARLRKLNGTN